MNKFLVISLLLISPQLYSQSLFEIRDNNRAVDYTENENLSKAAQALHSLIAQNPDLAVSRLNLASVYSLNQDPTNAISLLKELEEQLSLMNSTKDSVDDSIKKLLFISRFNLGFLHSLEKKSIVTAVDYYGKALEIYPNDLATKVNIELLVQNQKSQNQKKQQNDDQDKKGDEGEDKKKQQQEKNDKNQEKKPPKQQKKKPQKKKFKENELKKRDVKRIFEELKRQEEKIRAKVNKQNQQEQKLDKDW